MNIENSETLFQRAQKVSPGGVHSPVRAFRGVGGTPRFIARAQGPYLVDVDGHHYIDFCMSWGPLLFGHHDEETAEAAKAAIDRGWSYGTAEPYSLELVEFITQHLPWAEKVRLVTSGTEAVMSALRVARAATGRNKILKFDGCYHGHSDSMLVRAGSGLAEAASPDSAGVTPAVAGDTLVCPLDDDLALEQIFSQQGQNIAAAIIEPLPANNGLLIQREEFLQKLSTLCRQHGALLIFDEVISGFRVAFGGMAQLTNIHPDLVTYGKLMGGGFPVAAYAGKASLLDLVAPAGPVYQAGTLSANPVAMVVGLTTLKKLKRDNPYPILEKRAKHIAQEIQNISRALGKPISVQQYASIFWLTDFSEKPIRSQATIPPTQKGKFAKIFHALLNRGIYLAPSGFEVSFLATVHEDSIIEQFLNKFKEAIHEF